MDLYTTFPSLPLERLAAFADEAERRGYRGVLATENTHDSFLPLAAAARMGRALRLGTGVTTLIARHPVTVAQMSWDLQVSTGGQFVLGVCTQLDVHLTTRYGIDCHNKHERIVEAVAAIREVWSSWLEDREPHFLGAWYRITACPPAFRPTTRPDVLPKVFLLCSSEEDAAIAHRGFDGVLTHPMWSTRQIDPFSIALRRKALSQGTHSPEVIAGTLIATGETREEYERSRQNAQRRLAAYLRESRYDFAFRASGVWNEIQSIRAQPTNRPMNWADTAPETVYRTFVCDVPLDALGETLPRHVGSAVNGIFPNPISDMPELLPGEAVAAIRF